MYLKDGQLSGTTTCLWEAMTRCDAQHMREHPGLRGDSASEYGELLRRLGECQCLSGQEIGVTPSPQGWVINIRSCYESGQVDILIPRDRAQPVRVLLDTRKESHSYEHH